MLSKIIATITNRPDKRTAAELREAHAQIDQTALEAKVEELEGRRRKLLLRGTDVELEAIGREIAAGNLECERASAATDELGRLIVAADARENEEQIELQAAEAQRAAQHLTKSYAEIDRLADTIRVRLGEASSSAKTVARWNRKAEEISQPDRRFFYLDPATVKQRLAGGLR